MSVLSLILALLLCSSFKEATPFAISRSKTLCGFGQGALFVWKGAFGRTFNCCERDPAQRPYVRGAARRHFIFNNFDQNFEQSSALLSSAAPEFSSFGSEETPLRNVAIVAHVDHGKTTAVDALLEFAAPFSGRQAKKPVSFPLKGRCVDVLLTGFKAKETLLFFADA